MLLAYTSCTPVVPDTVMVFPPPTETLAVEAATSTLSCPGVLAAGSEYVVLASSTVRGVAREITPLLTVSDARLKGTFREVAVRVRERAASVLCDTSAAHPRLIGTPGIPAATHTPFAGCAVMVQECSMIGRLVIR